MQGYTKISMTKCRGVEIIVCAVPSIGVDHHFGWCEVLLNSAGPLRWHLLWHYEFVCSSAQLHPNVATVDLGKIDRKLIKYHNKINTVYQRRWKGLHGSLLIQVEMIVPVFHLSLDYTQWWAYSQLHQPWLEWGSRGIWNVGPGEYRGSGYWSLGSG